MAIFHSYVNLPEGISMYIPMYIVSLLPLAMFRPTEISQALKAIRLQWHPDKSPGRVPFEAAYHGILQWVPYSYGHLSVLSTYNPIYRMYNPIYNQL